MWKIRSFASRFVGPGDRKVRFLRHKEIYRPMSSYGSRPGQLSLDRPGPHRYDEFPAGYSLAGCAPAEPASASPAQAHREGRRSGSTIEKQRMASSVLTACLTQGDNPKGVRIKLQEQPFHVLTVLLQRPGEVVTREELRNQNWPADTFVDFDNSLNTSINKLRDALGDSADSPRFIETLPRRGYRFIGAVNGAELPRAVEAKPTQGLRSLIVPVIFGLLVVICIT